ncbi:MAG TPA: hypothetical protein VM692_13625 [Gammaproteobacteria bacterium]|nr:hypothetical protein [Gammaproteobacteria bacterium]
MSSATIARTFAVGAVTVAVALVLWTRSRAPGGDAPAISFADTDVTPAAVATSPPDSPPSDAREATVAAKVAELDAMSETYRNTTFLIAIRDGGFVCNELLRVYGALDDAPKWLVTCSEMLSYTVGVAGNGALHVEPMMQYFDGPVQTIQQVEPGPRPSQPQVQPRLR